MNLTLKSALAVFGGVAIMLPLATLAQVNSKNQGYLVTGPNFNVVTAVGGTVCVRTSDWTPARAAAAEACKQCTPDLCPGRRRRPRNPFRRNPQAKPEAKPAAKPAPRKTVAAKNQFLRRRAIRFRQGRLAARRQGDARRSHARAARRQRTKSFWRSVTPIASAARSTTRSCRCAALKPSRNIWSRKA